MHFYSIQVRSSFLIQVSCMVYTIKKLEWRLGCKTCIVYTGLKSVTDFDLGFKLDKHPRPCFEHLDRYAVLPHNLHGLRCSSRLNTSISVSNYCLMVSSHTESKHISYCASIIFTVSSLCLKINVRENRRANQNLATQCAQNVENKTKQIQMYVLLINIHTTVILTILLIIL